jgi:signal transduction histidine kinase
MSLLSSLSNRIFLASALLTVLSIGVAVGVINRTATARAEEDLARSLEEAGTLVEQFQSLLFEHLVREARLIADLPKLKAAVDVDHEPTVQPLAADYRTQIDADLFLVTNREGRTLGLAEDLGLPPEAVVGFDGTKQARAGHETVSFWPRPEGLLQVVSVPIYLGPEVLGTLTAGVSLDRRLATRIKALTRTEVVFGSEGVIHASTLPDANFAELAPLLTTPGVATVVVGGEEFVAVRRLLVLGPAQRGVTPGSPGSTDNSGSLGIGSATPGVAPAAAAAAQASGGSPGAGSGSSVVISGSGVGVDDAARAPVAVILRSRTEHLRFLRTLHTALAFTALAAVIGATVLSFAVARTITRPLGGLIATMREMAATGDLTRQLPSVPASRWEDEDARVLTSTFRALTASLGRFQHEAAQRERLSSLGRLSTVVAHEIRNPLMIIKASLRTLRRDARHPDASEAIGDIEEEVRRLNALVNEVLDYAKPIRFDYGAVDLNALCRAAATAASADQPAPAVRLFEDRKAGEIVTDAERLRLVLINVLTNARDAVLARQAGAETAMPAAASSSQASSSTAASVTPAAQATAAGSLNANVELRTDCPGTDTVRITVTDRGSGILPEHLARIFDPFFTTKRTGSGLGLAIAKNIVEGLGGTIAIASEPSRGTTVRITLPREAPRDRRQAGEA